MARGIVVFALMAALASASAQEGGEGLRGARTPPPAAEGPEESLVDRLAALRAEQMTELDGLLNQAARAHAESASLMASGQTAAAERAERIASAAVELAEGIVRRERLRARIARIVSERRQIAAGMERARAAVQHAREASTHRAPDPNAPDPNDDGEGEGEAP